MTHTIISKRTSPFIYTKWIYANGQWFRYGKSIMINGGSGIVGGSELLSGKPLEERSSVVPVGVMTFVDDQTLDKLMTIGKFRKDIERGLIVVVRGRKLDQDKANTIADNDMLANEHIPTRPVTPSEIEAAGGVINRDGSVDISNVDDDASPLRIRKLEAGLPSYVKRDNLEKRKQNAAEKKSRGRRRK